MEKKKKSTKTVKTTKTSKKGKKNKVVATGIETVLLGDEPKVNLLDLYNRLAIKEKFCYVAEDEKENSNN